MKNTLIGPENGRMEAVHLVHFLDSFLDIPGAAWDLDLLIYLSDLPPDFSTTSNLVESVFRAGDGSEKAFYRRADSRLPQAGGGR
ncbi:hypothetical protein, partial [Pseudomonas aeruginosa]|uniref:hypothetical protein n=1 Tax=Pseudomonas aeruginosa TaxID=287 RepID=UPI0029BFC5A1